MTAAAAARGWRNAADRYGRVSQTFHWLVAALIVTASALGLSLDSWPRENPTRETVIFVHKSLGVTVLLLALLRVSWFAAAALHVIGAAKHAFVDRDTAMFRRMWGR